jgi:hypothetical protein
MFFLNLTAAEFLTLLGGLSGLIAALYLLDRSKRKRIVSTLRFWAPAASARANQRRKRIRDPWSLILQLASLLLLLLAIAQLQWGARERRGRNYVVLLDTSAWSAERNGDITLLDREKEIAERYLAALAPADRIMLVRTDALAAPITPFTAERSQIMSALHGMAAGYSALNIEQALTFAQQAQGWSGGEPGEVVYIGPGMTPESVVAAPLVPNLRVIAVERVRQHAGIRGMSVERKEAGENAWQAAVTVKNYGTERATVRVETRFAGTGFAPRVVSLEGGADRTVEYNFVTDTAGQLAAELKPGDNLMGDDRVVLHLPRIRFLRVAVFTDRPELFRPLFSANGRLQVHFFATSGQKTDGPADVMVLDRTARAVPPNVASIWIDPPRDGSPLPVKALVREAAIRNWHSEIPLGEGLHAKDTRIPDAEVFQTFDGDMVVGAAAEGPVVVARGASQSRGDMAVIGFDPLSGEARLDLTTPLLFANLLRWISPAVFRSVELAAERVGAVSMPLDPGEPPDRIRIFDERGMSVPFVAAKQTLQLFASAPEVLRVTSEGRERTLSVALPDVAAFEWKPPSNTATGLPVHSRFAPAALDLWRWLALVGGLGLFLEWTLFGRQRFPKRQIVGPESARRPIAEPERELAAK